MFIDGYSVSAPCTSGNRPPPNKELVSLPICRRSLHRSATRAPLPGRRSFLQPSAERLSRGSESLPGRGRSFEAAARCRGERARGSHAMMLRAPPCPAMYAALAEHWRMRRAARSWLSSHAKPVPSHLPQSCWALAAFRLPLPAASTPSSSAIQMVISAWLTVPTLLACWRARCGGPDVWITKHSVWTSCRAYNAPRPAECSTRALICRPLGAGGVVPRPARHGLRLQPAHVLHPMGH